MALPKLSADDAESIYRVETIPPPDGDDAYSAATKVGPLSTAQVLALMQGSDDAAPQSGIQVRRPNVTVDALSIEVDTAGLDDACAPDVPASPQRVALAATRAPALLPPPFDWQVAPMPMPMPVAAAQSVPTTPRPRRSSAALVVAIAIAGLVVFAAGAWMVMSVFVNQ